MKHERHGPVHGTVVLWHSDEGWGAVASPEVDGEVWVFFSDIVADGFHELHEGEAVTFVYETPGFLQDGYPHRALWVETSATTDAMRDEFARGLAMRDGLARSPEASEQSGNGLRAVVGVHGFLIETPPGAEPLPWRRLSELGPDVMIPTMEAIAKRADEMRADGREPTAEEWHAMLRDELE